MALVALVVKVSQCQYLTNHDRLAHARPWHNRHRKQAEIVLTMAEIPEVPAKKRAFTVYLVNVFGNDAGAKVAVK